MFFQFSLKILLEVVKQNLTNQNISTYVDEELKSEKSEVRIKVFDKFFKMFLRMHLHVLFGLSCYRNGC